MIMANNTFSIFFNKMFSKTNKFNVIIIEVNLSFINLSYNLL